MIVSKMTQEEKGYGRSYNLYRSFLAWTFVQVFSKKQKYNNEIFFHTKIKERSKRFGIPKTQRLLLIHNDNK